MTKDEALALTRIETEEQYEQVRDFCDEIVITHSDEELDASSDFDKFCDLMEEYEDRTEKWGDS